jgi:hypothetical protein
VEIMESEEPKESGTIRVEGRQPLIYPASGGDPLPIRAKRSKRETTTAGPRTGDEVWFRSPAPKGRQRVGGRRQAGEWRPLDARRGSASIRTVSGGGGPGTGKGR